MQSPLRTINRKSRGFFAAAIVVAIALVAWKAAFLNAGQVQPEGLESRVLSTRDFTLAATQLARHAFENPAGTTETAAELAIQARVLAWKDWVQTQASQNGWQATVGVGPLSKDDADQLPSQSLANHEARVGVMQVPLDSPTVNVEGEPVLALDSALWFNPAKGKVEVSKNAFYKTTLYNALWTSSGQPVAITATLYDSNNTRAWTIVLPEGFSS